MPGCVGDSPILGARLDVQNGVGAAGSTGRGESNLYGGDAVKFAVCTENGAALQRCEALINKGEEFVD